jgi:hypothetical protein
LPGRFLGETGLDSLPGFDDDLVMKTAYELAMERLNKSSPTVKLTDKQKKELAELDALYKAKVAEREIAVRSEMDAAAEKMDMELMAKLDNQLLAERQRLEADLDEKKNKIRQRGKSSSQ